MNTRFECLYCGNIWEEFILNRFTLQNAKCAVCNDKNLKTTDMDRQYVDYYGESQEPTKEVETIPSVPLDDYDDYL